MQIKYAFAALLMTVTGPTLAQDSVTEEPAYEHAISAQDLVAMAKIIPFPRGSKSTHIWCHVKIDTRGRLQGGCLFDGHVGRDLATKMRRYMRRFKVRPARIDGEPVEVWGQFSVFYTAGDQRKITVTANSGALAKQFGLGYVSPQRVSKINFIACPMWGKISDNCKDQGLKFLINTEVDASGNMTACEIAGENTSGANADAICAAEMTFVPGTVEGRATAMAYTEPWY